MDAITAFEGNFPPPFPPPLLSLSPPPAVLSLSAPDDPSDFEARFSGGAAAFLLLAVSLALCGLGAASCCLCTRLCPWQTLSELRAASSSGIEAAVGAPTVVEGDWQLNDAAKVGTHVFEMRRTPFQSFPTHAPHQTFRAGRCLLALFFFVPGDQRVYTPEYMVVYHVYHSIAPPPPLDVLSGCLSCPLCTGGQGCRVARGTRRFVSAEWAERAP